MESHLIPFGTLNTLHSQVYYLTLYPYSSKISVEHLIIEKYVVVSKLNTFFIRAKKIIIFNEK